MPSVDADRGAVVADQVHALQKIKIHTLDYIIAQRDRVGKAFFHDHISGRVIERQVIDFI
jgi:hypothetical protein